MNKTVFALAVAAMAAFGGYQAALNSCTTLNPYYGTDGYFAECYGGTGMEITQ